MCITKWGKDDNIKERQETTSRENKMAARSEHEQRDDNTKLVTPTFSLRYIFCMVLTFLSLTFNILSILATYWPLTAC